MVSCPFSGSRRLTFVKAGGGDGVVAPPISAEGPFLKRWKPLIGVKVVVGGGALPPSKWKPFTSVKL